MKYQEKSCKSTWKKAGKLEKKNQGKINERNHIKHQICLIINMMIQYEI